MKFILNFSNSIYPDKRIKINKFDQTNNLINSKSKFKSKSRYEGGLVLEPKKGIFII